MAGPVRHGELEGLRQDVQLPLAGDERCILPSGDRRVADNRDEPVCAHRVGLSLQPQGLHRLGLDCVADEPEGRLAEQDLPRLGCLLQPRGDVDRIAGGEALAGAGHDLAAVQADARPDPELGQRVAHLRRRAHRAQRVVLVDERNAEHRHDGVSDEFLHGAAVGLDDRLHLVEVPRQQCPQRLRIERLPERGRARDVTEQNGHGLALLALEGARLERSPARVAEAGAGAILRVAAHTKHVLEARTQLCFLQAVPAAPREASPAPRLAGNLLWSG